MLSSKANMTACSPRSAAATAYCTAIVDFPLPAGPINRVLVPRSGPPPSSVSSAVTPLLIRSARKGFAMFHGHQPRKSRQASPSNHEIVVTASIISSPVLDDPESPARGPVHGRMLLQ